METTAERETTLVPGAEPTACKWPVRHPAGLVCNRPSRYAVYWSRNGEDLRYVCRDHLAAVVDFLAEKNMDVGDVKVVRRPR